MKHFLLLHGSSHGAWCWEKCKSLLENRGDTVFAIDIVGEDFSSCLNVIKNFLDKRSETKFRVVAHSLAGIFIPELMQTHDESIESLICIAAIILEPGERVIDFIPEQRRPRYYEMAEASKDYNFKVNFEVAKAAFFNDLSEKEAKEYYKLLTPQPFKVYLEKARYSFSSVTCHRKYILCAQDAALSFSDCIKFSKRLGGEVLEIEAGHDAMLSKPEELISLLSERVSES